MGPSTTHLQRVKSATTTVSLLSLASLVLVPVIAKAAVRPIRPGGATPPPTVVNPNPPPRPSQMTAGRNSGNMVVATPLLRTVQPAAVPVVAPVVRVTTDP